MTSQLYTCRVSHRRLQPLGHEFSYGVYMALMDLTSLPPDSAIFKKDGFALFGFSQNRYLRHLKDDGPAKSLFERARGLMGQDLERIELVTYLEILGYVFNPVSFYIGYRGDAAVAAMAEVTNTFGEVKLFHLQAQNRGSGCETRFALRAPKHFYVSPYGALTDDFSFDLRLPGERLAMKVDTLERDSGKTVLEARLTGERLQFSDRNLLALFMRYPLVTLKVITSIHWQALLLFLKGAKARRKEDNPEEQTEISYRPSRR